MEPIIRKGHKPLHVDRIYEKPKKEETPGRLRRAWNYVGGMFGSNIAIVPAIAPGLRKRRRRKRNINTKYKWELEEKLLDYTHVNFSTTQSGGYYYQGEEVLARRKRMLIDPASTSFIMGVMVGAILAG